MTRAVRFVRLHAPHFGLDPERIGVYGGSAGGHLSLMLGLASDEGNPDATDEVLRQSSRVAAVIANFPPVDLRQRATASERLRRVPRGGAEPCPAMDCFHGAGGSPEPSFNGGGRAGIPHQGRGVDGSCTL